MRRMVEGSSTTGNGGGAGERKKKKMTMGRQKIEMKRIANEEARQVCFSKRRIGLFKKANELSILCGAHVAIVVFSPAGRPFSFGHPSVPAVLDRFLSPASSSADHPPSPSAAVPPHPAVVYEFDRQLEELAKAVEAARRRKEMLEEITSVAGVWSNADVQSKGLAELEAMLAALERVQGEAADRAKVLIAEEAMQSKERKNIIHYLGGGAFNAHHEPIMDNKMVMMATTTAHALAPALAPPPLLPPFNPPAFAYSNHISNNVPHGYNSVIGNVYSKTGRGQMYEVEGFFGHSNFFG